VNGETEYTLKISRHKEDDLKKWQGFIGMILGVVLIMASLVPVQAKPLACHAGSLNIEFSDCLLDGNREVTITGSFNGEAGYRGSVLIDGVIKYGPVEYTGSTADHNFSFTEVYPSGTSHTAVAVLERYASHKWSVVDTKTKNFTVPVCEPTPTDTVEPTPTDTLEPTPTDTVEPTPTDTVEPTPTDTTEPTPTDTVEPTPTDTVEPTPTDTVEPTPTDTPPVPSDTPTYTVTPSETPTHTATATNTNTPTSTATSTSTATATNTATNTNTPPVCDPTTCVTPTFTKTPEVCSTVACVTATLTSTPVVCTPTLTPRVITVVVTSVITATPVEQKTGSGSSNLPNGILFFPGLGLFAAGIVSVVVGKK